jgi:hypothetical protein
MTDTRIVRTSYRYKPPPRKRKTAPLAGPAVATKRATLPGTGKRAANDDRKLVAAKKPALIITASRRSCAARSWRWPTMPIRRPRHG